MTENTTGQSPDQNREQAPESQHHLDASGLVCPEPVMLLHNRVRDMASGEVLEVLATDPSTTRDIPRFCQFLGHTLAHQCVEGAAFRFWIRKK